KRKPPAQTHFWVMYQVPLLPPVKCSLSYSPAARAAPRCTLVIIPFKNELLKGLLCITLLLFIYSYGLSWPWCCFPMVLLSSLLFSAISKRCWHRILCPHFLLTVYCLVKWWRRSCCWWGFIPVRQPALWW